MTVADALEDSVLPQAGAVHADHGAPPSAELCPLPAALSRVPVDRKSAARWAYERLILYIRAFEDRLDPAEEVAVGFTGSEAGVLRIEGLGFFDPDLVTFYGRDDGGAKTQLIQHVTQLNVILRAVPRERPGEPPRRIGFQLVADLDAASPQPTDGDARSDP